MVSGGDEDSVPSGRYPSPPDTESHSRLPTFSTCAPLARSIMLMGSTRQVTRVFGASRIGAARNGAWSGEQEKTLAAFVEDRGRTSSVRHRAVDDEERIVDVWGCCQWTSPSFGLNRFGRTGGR